MEICNEQCCVMGPKIFFIISHATDGPAPTYRYSGTFYVRGIVMTNHAIRASYGDRTLAELILC